MVTSSCKVTQNHVVLLFWRLWVLECHSEKSYVSQKSAGQPHFKIWWIKADMPHINTTPIKVVNECFEYTKIDHTLHGKCTVKSIEVSNLYAIYYFFHLNCFPSRQKCSFLPKSLVCHALPSSFEKSYF